MTAPPVAVGITTPTAEERAPGGAPVLPGDASHADAIAGARSALQHAMTADAGVLRSAESLARAAAALHATSQAAAVAAPSTGPAYELAHLVTVAGALCAAAGARTESRGAHTRTDHPLGDPAQQVRYVIEGATPR